MPQRFSRTEMQASLAGAAALDEAGLKRRLRLLRRRVLLRAMARDLGGLADLAEVCETMSDLAECALQACVKHLNVPDLMVIGMGKLGGRELNVSSDIDLVFVLDEEDPSLREPAARRLIRLLADTTEDGFVFRVDMRLRPYGDAGPLVCNLDFLDTYFVAQGREWERYAWIKARPLTGSRHAQLSAIVRPFVYRKYLDYATLAAMRGLHAEVRREVARRELGSNVKLGPGGIREIEFVAQALQLIRGGRDPELQARPTLQILELLVKRKMLPEAAGNELAQAYVFLRRLEHRLQYLDDAQRHDLPEDDEDRGRIARMMRYESWDGLSRDLEAHRASVSRHFEAVFAQAPPAGEPWPEHPRLDQLRASQRYTLLPADSRRRLDVLIPTLYRAAHSTPSPEDTFIRGLNLVEAIASRAAYLALLAEHPQALQRVARIIGASSWAADYVTLHPLLLDELLDDRLLDAQFDRALAAEQLESQLHAAEGDAERQMNVLREVHQTQVFRLLAQDLAGRLTVETLADHLSALADLMLESVLRLVWSQLRNRHRADAPRFAVIAYGKLGGKELGYASDLDIIFLYDDADERAGEVYARLAQRMNRWLTTRTSAGLLFDTDLRLRPSGESGLLVSSLAGFEAYQERDAWVWEHQALTRARYCAGDAAVGASFENIRQRILRRARDAEGLKTDIIEMREKMYAAHPNESELFDVKHDRGGMIDIEFSVQYLVLAYSHKHAELTGNLGNIALLKIAAQCGLVPIDVAEQARNAYREYRRLQHGLRLNGAAYARVPPEQVSAHAAAVRALWGVIFPAT